MLVTKVSNSTVPILVVALVGLACGQTVAHAPDRGAAPGLQAGASTLSLEQRDGSRGGKVSVGTYRVLEDREARSGRMLDLDVVVLHALTPNPRPDPMFILAGGPGASAVRQERGLVNSWIRRDRDIVLVSQRGTQRRGGLRCASVGSDDDLQSYMDPAFELEPLQACMEQLSRTADLTKYSTPMAMDDLNDIRLALGYEQINLMGGSYGTRAALVYMRRHPESVRTAVLNGVAPIAFTNPLYHAAGAQEALDKMFVLCAADDSCRAAFPRPREELDQIFERLAKARVEVTIEHPVSRERERIALDRDAFAEALRTLLYYTPVDMEVPYLIHQAFTGDYTAFAQQGMRNNRSIRNGLAFGMLFSVTCAEDVARFTTDDVARETSGTFLQDVRARQQMAVCGFWPTSALPASHGQPVAVDVPVLLLSGTLDPVTPPRWGEEAASHLPNSLHLVVPGAHGVGGSCIRSIEEQFLERGALSNLNTSCVQQIRLPPFRVK